SEEPEGGYTLSDCADFLKMIEEDLDIVQLRGPSVVAAHPTGFNPEETPFLHYGEYIKKSGADVLVAVIGGFQNFESCEKAVAEGKTDMISMARSWVSNPDYGRLAYEEREEDLVPCLRCNKCHGRGREDPFVSVCAVNPLIGIEHMMDQIIEEPGAPQKIAVIGGGPAGMKAAMELADRNHRVTLFEAEDELGGAIKHSDYISFKWPLRDFKNYLIRQVEKRDISVEKNRRVTPEEIRKEGFDSVITALGAGPVIPPIPGTGLPHVVSAERAIHDPGSLGDEVVVIGGGEVGVEVAMHLAEKGHKATVLEMRDEIAADSTLIHYRSMFQEAWEALDKFHFKVSVRVGAIEEGRVLYPEMGEEKSIRADSVVISTGMKARSPEAMKFYGSAGRFYMIGDCRKPGALESAMRSAWSTAQRI
ncbi:MAG: FAD-dependent oxidoreductase, partial [Spirochaetales bacterium]|nr:FAD-dependent oxidoreductase [Spirochaetales bacterium]